MAYYGEQLFLARQCINQLFFAGLVLKMDGSLYGSLLWLTFIRDHVLAGFFAINERDANKILIGNCCTFSPAGR